MSTKFTQIRKKLIYLLFTTALMMLVFLTAEAGAVTLASSGSTSYSIVSDIANSNEVDLAVGTLVTAAAESRAHATYVVAATRALGATRQLAFPCAARQFGEFGNRHVPA